MSIYWDASSPLLHRPKLNQQRENKSARGKILNEPVSIHFRVINGASNENAMVALQTKDNCQRKQLPQTFHYFFETSLTSLTCARL